MEKKLEYKTPLNKVLKQNIKRRIKQHMKTYCRQTWPSSEIPTPHHHHRYTTAFAQSLPSPHCTRWVQTCHLRARGSARQTERETETERERERERETKGQTYTMTDRDTETERETAQRDTYTDI